MFFKIFISVSFQPEHTIKTAGTEKTKSIDKASTISITLEEKLVKCYIVTYICRFYEEKGSQPKHLFIAY